MGHFKLGVRAVIRNEKGEFQVGNYGCYWEWERGVDECNFKANCQSGFAFSFGTDDNLWDVPVDIDSSFTKGVIETDAKQAITSLLNDSAGVWW